MSHLTPEQLQLVMDFFFQCGDGDELERGRILIETDPEAARLYAFLDESLSGLDLLDGEECPDDLAALTIARLKLAARVQQSSPAERLDELLEHESRKTPTFDFSPSFQPQISSESKPHILKLAFEIAAMAAAVVLISGLLLPALSAVRNHSRQVACSVNLGRIGRALSAYADDNDGRFASAQLQPGQPWWMVGDQSEQPRSSTRYIWQLVRLGYVGGENFVCPGHQEGCPVQYNASAMANLRDFPSPQNISYSVMLRCGPNKKAQDGQRRIILSDMNPVFVSFRKRINCTTQREEYEKVLLNEDLKKLLSPNHNQRGQNVLFCDGSVEFLASRFYQEDDIFTVRGVEAYTGREAPADEKDIFLVP
ncbi:MAG TPA: hypothetical protein PKY88_09910 [Anaerohalosphaeraceae bacterium]|nr:hypothetical protein [Anaerohalosphaeraceae bacterium]